MSLNLIINAREFLSKTKVFRLSLIEQIKNRLAKGLDVRIIVTGEAGFGKSTLALWLAHLLDPLYQENPQEAVDKRVCFKGIDYLIANQEAPHGACLIMDESGQAIHHRQFMSEVNIFLSMTLIGNRFRRFIQIFCIPSLELLDKDARGMVQLIMHIDNIGEAMVYRVRPPRLEGKTFYKRKIDHYRFAKCPAILWHIYEKKKRKAQDELNDGFIKLLTQNTNSEREDEQYVEMVLKEPAAYKLNERWHVPLIRTKLRISRDKADSIRAILKQREEQGLIE